jgi:uncharacterized protein (DUF4415 family)
MKNAVTQLMCRVKARSSCAALVTAKHHDRSIFKPNRERIEIVATKRQPRGHNAVALSLSYDVLDWF